jgi:hypothetical protein
MPTPRRLSRTAQLALAAAAAWAIVVVPYAVSLVLDLINYGGAEDLEQAFADIPILLLFVLLPLIAFVLSIRLAFRLHYGEETPRDRAFAIALLGPGLAWVALVLFVTLS